MKQKFNGSAAPIIDPRYEGDNKVIRTRQVIRLSHADGLGSLNFLGFLNPLAENTKVTFNVADTISALKGNSSYNSTSSIADEQRSTSVFENKTNAIMLGVGGVLLVGVVVLLVVLLAKRK